MAKIPCMDAVVSVLASEGVDITFGCPGAAILPLYAALERLHHSFIEASLDLGDGHLRAFWTVIGALAAPGLVGLVRHE